MRRGFPGIAAETERGVASGGARGCGHIRGRASWLPTEGRAGDDGKNRGAVLVWRKKEMARGYGRATGKKTEVRFLRLTTGPC